AIRGVKSHLLGVHRVFLLFFSAVMLPRCQVRMLKSTRALVSRAVLFPGCPRSGRGISHTRFPLWDRKSSCLTPFPRINPLCGVPFGSAGTWARALARSLVGYACP